MEFSIGRSFMVNKFLFFSYSLFRFLDTPVFLIFSFSSALFEHEFRDFLNQEITLIYFFIILSIVIA